MFYLLDYSSSTLYFPRVERLRLEGEALFKVGTSGGRTTYIYLAREEVSLLRGYRRGAVAA